MPSPSTYVFTIRPLYVNGQIAIAPQPSPFTPEPKLVAVGTGATGGSGLTDGDKGDIVVSGSGAALNIDSAVMTPFARTLNDDASAAAMRSTLGLGTAATSNTTAFEAAGAVSSAIASHVADGDPHPQYLTEASAATQLAAKADLVGGVVPTSQIPATAITEFLGSVSSQSAMLALSGQRGDWCIRTDLNRTYFLTVDAPSLIGSWQYIETPASPVTSVNGQSGVIVLGPEDVGAVPESHAGSGGSAHAAVQAGGPHGFMTGTDKTKLDGIASGATANSADATLLERANHTGSQLAATISDFTEASQDIIGAMIAAAGGSYNDGAGTIALPASPIEVRRVLFECDFTHVNAVQGPFIVSGVGTGTSFTSAPIAGAISANHPGVLRLISGTTANSGIAIMTSVTNFRIGGGEQFDCWFYTAPDFTTVTTRLGEFDSATSTSPIDGVFFNMSGSGAIIGRTRNNNTESSTATMATLSPSTWYHARITINADATSATFQVFDDGGTSLGSASLTTNIPTARESGWGAFSFSSGTSAIDVCHIDKIMVTNPGRTLARGAP